MATSHDHLDILLETARAGQLDEFRLLVQDTMCINEIHPITHELIVETLAKEGYDEIVRYLMTQGADLNSACYGAARGGKQVLMNELLSKGAKKRCAVDGAACGGHFELMWSLIRSGADPDFALMGASQNGDPTQIQALIEKGARISYALVGAIISGNEERIRSSMSYSRHPRLVEIAARYGRISLLDELEAHCVPARIPALVARNLAEGGHEAHFLQRYGEHSDCLAQGIWGAASGGHYDFLIRLIEHANHFHLLDHKIALKYAIFGAAESNHSHLVHHLIARGASIEEALIGAAIGENFDLVDQLIERGTTAGQLRKDVAVHAAAMSKRYDLMNDWLAEGASLNQALRGICNRGNDIQMAMQLIKQGASPEWVWIGYCEGLGFGIFEGDRENLLELIPKTVSVQNTDTFIKASAENAFFGGILFQLQKLEPEDQDKRQEILNAAASGAARGGFRTKVRWLLHIGANRASAMEGAVEADDRYLMNSLLIEDPDVMRTGFKIAFAMGRADQVQWMLRYSIDGCVDVIKSMSNPNEAVQALSMIQDSMTQFEVAHQASVAHLITTAQIVKIAKVSPQIAFASMKMGPSLRYLSTLCFLNKPRFPKEVVNKLLSYVAASEGDQIPESDIPALMRASNLASSPDMGAEDRSSGNCCIL